MFDFGRKKTTGAPADDTSSILETQVFLHPSAAVVEITDQEFDRYKRRATEMNFFPAALCREELMRYLKTQNAGIYNYDEVVAFLEKEFGEPGSGAETRSWIGQTWSWRALTEVDIDQHDLGLWENRNGGGNGEHALPGTYQGKIPFDVLDRAGKMRDILPFVHFFVSDNPTRREREMGGDPFLAVTWPGLEEMIIIEQWDEPNFFGKPKQPE